MHSIISYLNDVLNQWKKDHDIFSAVSSQFSESEGFLCFQDLPLCKLDKSLEMEGAEYDSESIQFYLNDNRSILIYMSWQVNEPPIVENVALIYRLHEEAGYIRSPSKYVSSAF